MRKEPMKMFLWADDTPSATDLGNSVKVIFFIMGGIAAFLGAAVAVKTLVQRKPEEEMAVTRKEVRDGYVSQSDHKDVLRELALIRSEQVRLENNMAAMHTTVSTVDSNSRANFHRVRESLGPISMRLVRIDIILAMMAEKHGIPIPKETEMPMLDKLLEARDGINRNIITAEE